MVRALRGKGTSEKVHFCKEPFKCRHGKLGS